MKYWFVGLSLICDICQTEDSAKGVDRKDAEADARVKGWSVGASTCRCPKHKGMRAL